ncbi:MAG: hypothetical protein GY725_25340 [bacterium]|nr:hypothetical protein [bacterium]
MSERMTGPAHDPTRPKNSIHRGLFLVLGLFCFACSSGPDEDTWVARVDSAPISFGELQRLIAEGEKLHPETRREDLLNQVLNRLVSDQVVLNRAQEAGVGVIDEEIDRRLRRLHGPDFGKIDTEFRESVRREMTLERMTLFDLAKKMRVSEASISLHYEENKARYKQPVRVQIRQIVVEEREKAEKLRKELRGGADFSELADEHSLAPEASEGGLLPPFAAGELPEAFDEAFKLKKGKRALSKVIESPYGFHVFKLESRTKAKQREFQEVREEIVMELERQRLEELRREWLRGLRRDANIQVNDELLKTLR